MSFLKTSPPPDCFLNQHCSRWAHMYFKYCLCSTKDGISLFLGAASIISWVIAEVPQIMTNYYEKSTEGLSIAFLMTWIVGDLFNLIGCLLEPATLPTQYYVALLYTATTVILTGQTIYYGYIYHKLEPNKHGIHVKSQKHHQEHGSAKECLLGDSKKTRVNGYRSNGTNPSKEVNIPSSPIPVEVLCDSCGSDFYYTSARSLSKSPVPAFGAWLAHSCDNGGSPPRSGNQQSAAKEPLLDRIIFPQSAPPNLRTKNMLAIVPSAVFFFVMCVVLHLCINDGHTASPNGMVIRVGRKLLQDYVQDDGSSGVGNLLGWAMAAIYMGARLPQIYLNVRMNSVYGLNPLMFVFAVSGNATYVGSILVESWDWHKIRPNLPWLADAVGCIQLDGDSLVVLLLHDRGGTTSDYDLQSFCKLSQIYSLDHVHEQELGLRTSDDEVTNRFIYGQIDSTETFASLWSVFDLGLLDLIVSHLP
ncbi:PQ loop repeat domain containing protein [Musa troglodytarum]|nr:PQ loop repeat domain containing protein [Musa troglodytarum]